MVRKIVSIGLMAFLMSVGMAHAEEKNVRWSVSVDMSMTQPMSMKMPTYTSKVCGAADPEKNPPPMKNGDCTVEKFDQTGKRTNFKVACDQSGTKMVGEGWAEKIDDDHYKGHMKINGDSGGMAMAMEMNYQGTRIGTCTEEGVEQ